MNKNNTNIILLVFIIIFLVVGVSVFLQTTKNNNNSSSLKVEISKWSLGTEDSSSTILDTRIINEDQLRESIDLSVGGNYVQTRIIKMDTNGIIFRIMGENLLFDSDYKGKFFRNNQRIELALGEKVVITTDSDGAGHKWTFTYE